MPNKKRPEINQNNRNIARNLMDDFAQADTEDAITKFINIVIQCAFGCIAAQLSKGHNLNPVALTIAAPFFRTAYNTMTVQQASETNAHSPAQHTTTTAGYYTPYNQQTNTPTTLTRTFKDPVSRELITITVPLPEAPSEADTNDIDLERELSFSDADNETTNPNLVERELSFSDADSHSNGEQEDHTDGDHTTPDRPTRPDTPDAPVKPPRPAAADDDSTPDRPAHPDTPDAPVTPSEPATDDEDSTSSNMPEFGLSDTESSNGDIEEALDSLDVSFIFPEDDCISDDEDCDYIVNNLFNADLPGNNHDNGDNA